MERVSMVAKLTPPFVVLAIYTSYFRWFSAFVKPGEHPDEIQHLTYLRDVFNGRLIPNYAPGASGSYLEHPALYYTLVGKFAWLFPGFDLGIFVANYLLGLTCALLLYDFAKVVSGDRVAGLVSATCAIMVPYFGYIFTGANNDNLAMLLVFCTGSLCARYYITKEIRWFEWAVVPALLVSLVKATATIQAGVLVVPAAIMVLRAEGISAIWRVTSRPVVALSLICVVLYYGIIIAQYGEPFPRPVRFYEAAMASMPALFLEERWTVAQYVVKYYRDMVVQLSGIYSHTIYQYTRDAFSFWPLAYAASVATVGMWLVNRQVRWLCASLLLALVIFGAMHFTIMYRTHLENGYVGGLQ